MSGGVYERGEEDTLGVNEYFKTVAYASLYKTASGGQGKVRADDITLSLVRESAPRELLKSLHQQQLQSMWNEQKIEKLPPLL